MTAGTPTPAGRFIAIEGPEGGGKTSQAARLRDAIAAAGAEVVLTREPGGTPAGERIRELLLAGGGSLDPRTDALLFSAARSQLVADVIRPALARGAVVIATRYADSTLAYQGYGAGLPIDELVVLERFATGGLRPDLTILLDVPAEIGLARKTGDERTRFEREFDLEFHRKVRDGFLELAREQRERYAIVDATADEDSVFASIVEAARRFLRAPDVDRPGPRRAPDGEPEAPPVRIHR